MQIDLLSDSGEEAQQQIDVVVNDMPGNRQKNIVYDQEKNFDENATFEDLGVNPNIIQSLAAHKIVRPTAIQQHAIPTMLSGSHDCAVIAPTASGKTLTFLIPIISDLQMNPIFYHSIVIAPTRELAYQINEQFAIYLAAFGLYSNLFIGGSSQLDDNLIFSSGFYVAVCTPGRLLACLKSRSREEMKQNFSHLQYLVLDEADQFLDGSEDFNRAFNEILEYLPPAGERRTILTTASLSSNMKQLLKSSRFSMIQSIQKIPGNLHFKYILAPQEFYKSSFLVFIIHMLWGGGELDCSTEYREVKNPNFSQLVVFVSNSMECEVINRLLLKYKFQSCSLHGQLTMDQRIQNLSAFKVGRCKVMVCTDVAARGLDIQYVDFVINYSMPRTIEEFQHRAGRCARGYHGRRDGTVINIIQSDEYLIQKEIKERLGINIEKIKQLWDYSNNNQKDIDEEQIIREYFGRTVRAEKKFKLEMIDQDVGRRIRDRERERQKRNQNEQQQQQQ